MSTPLPSSTIGSGAIYSPSGSSSSPQQPRAAPVAHFASLPNDGIGNVREKSPAIPTSGRLLAANSKYIAYAVKKGLVRVIDRHTAAKTLLRGHADETRIVDAAFFGTEGTAQRKEGISALWNQLCNNATTNNDGGGGNAPQHAPPAAASDVLATVGGMKDSACVLIWKIKSSDDDDNDLEAEKLFELRYPHATRIVWHPFNPNRFLLLTRTYDEGEWDNSQRSVASIVDTSRLNKTFKDGYALCDCGDDKVLNGAAQFYVSANENTGANDVSWSHVKDARHVFTGHDDGKVRLWDLTKNDGSTVSCLHELDVASGMEESSDKRVTRVLFLSQYESADSDESMTPPFIVGTDSNQTITLWSGFPSNGDAPQRLRVFRLADVDPTSLVSVEMCPSPYRPPVSSSSPSIPSSFLLLAERKKGCVHALHLDTEWKEGSSTVVVKGFDYVSTLNVVHPVYSLCIAPTEESGASLEEEKDVELCCIQSKAVQVLTLSAAMCAAPSKDVGGTERGDLANGVTLIDLPTEVSDEEAFEDFEDEYEMEDEVEYSTNHSGGIDEDEDVEETPVVVPTATMAEPNAFSNWLGAIANPIPVPSVPAPPVPATKVKSPTPPPGLGFPTILPPLPPAPDVSDSQFLSPMQILSGSENKAEPSKKAKKKKETAKKASTPAAPIAPVAILKREEPKKEAVVAPIPQKSAAPQKKVDVGSSSDGNVEAVISSYMKSHEAEMATVIRKAVASEVETAVRSNMRGVEKAAEQAVQRALAADGKFEKKLEKQAKESAAMAAKEAVAAMQAPIVSSLHQVMREVMIPSYESATRQMFHQISTSVEKGLAQRPANDASSSASLQAMSEQMMKMAVAIQTLSNEVLELRGEVKARGKADAAAQQSQQTKTKPDVRGEIVHLCQLNRFEEAFTKAVSASDGDIVLFACKSADSSAVFGGDSVGISQPILICLMQQLGAILVTITDAADFKILLAWLQEIAVTIDPTDASIQRHVASVVQQLLANINSKMANCDHAFRRPLQTLMQVIRGLAL
mmetsp:Transcript_26144/g.41060  ORF Transcript_26144/g.41060 Transcript_26144/m.41060 type:complete len:1029 (-) Transcript_26144:78-3164(-)